MVPPYTSAFYTDEKIEGLEKYVELEPNKINALLDLAHLYEVSDIVYKAAATARKVKQLGKSDYVNKSVGAILDYQSSIKAGKPYEGCLQLIKSETIDSDEIKKALIGKLLKEYPHTKNSSRSELEKIRAGLRL